jgi:hypothetical protein
MGYYCSTNLSTGIYILKKIRNYTKTKVQNGETLPKLNIGIYSKFDQYYRYNIIMYDFIHIIQFLIPIWSWISKMMLENETFFHFSFEMLLFVRILKKHIFCMANFFLSLENFVAQFGKNFAKIQKKIRNNASLVPWINCHL